MASRTLRNLVVSPYRWLLRGLWALQRPPRNPQRRRRVLLCAETEMMTSYANAAAQLVAEEPQVATYFTQAPSAGTASDALRPLAQELGHNFVPYWKARMQWWDLIVFPEYRAADRFHPDAPKVLVNHFLDSGKIINGKEYRFERELVHLGRPLFRKIFDASYVSRDRAIAGDPQLEDQIVVVGDLRSDEMFKLVDRREEIRREFGFQSDETVVLIQSTWGPQSIMERWGSQLLEEALELQKSTNFRFIASTHPLHWSGRRVAEHPWGEHLLSLQPRGLRVVRPGDDWAVSMVASDVAISDNTSLAATYCQLGKPLIFINDLEDYLPEGTSISKLYKISPHLANAEDLHRTLCQVQDDYPYEELREIAYAVNSYPGEAEQKIRAELLEVLHLDA